MHDKRKEQKKNILTDEGLEKLKNELRKREEVYRKRIADEIDEAKKIGDLSENSAYTAALEKFRFNENKIRDIKNQIAQAVLTDSTKRGGKLVGLGTEVKIRDKESGEEKNYSIVGDKESDPFKGKISLSSPIGNALQDTKVGDIVSVKLPNGTKKYEVLALENK